MKIDDVRGLTPDQLAESLINLKKEQFNLRFQKATGQVEKTHRVDQVRKDIARIKTVIVKVERTFLHPVLKKTVRRSKKYHAHDEANAYKAGDNARIIECAPKSKTK